MKQNLQKLINWLIYNKTNIAIAVIVLSIIIFGKQLTAPLGFAAIIVWLLLLSAIMLMAGLTVIKSLFKVGAEISLIFFIGQFYCSLPARTYQNDEAMRNLIFLGIAYIIFAFIGQLWNFFKEWRKEFQKDHSAGKYIFIIIFSLFISWFILNIYSVLNAMLHGLCINLT
ncbi:MAG: hypothetical protein WA093_03425 [Minisyncoccales bacterium]